MNSRRLKVLALSSFLLCGSVNAAAYHTSPYYKEGRNFEALMSADFAQTATAAFLRTFVQESPSSEPFKKAFTRFQLVIRGVHDEIKKRNPSTPLSQALVLALQSFTDASDLAGALCSLGNSIQAISSQSGSVALEFLDDSTTKFLFTSAPVKGSHVYKKGYALCNGTILNLLNCLKGNMLFKEYLYAAFKDYRELHDVFTHPSRAISKRRLIDVLGGIQDRLGSFHMLQQEPRTEKQVALFADLIIKCAAQALALPKDYYNNQLPQRLYELGHVFIDCGTQLKKLS